MPLACLDADGAALNAALMPDSAWAAVHRVRPRADLSCRSCRARVHPKRSVRGTRFFAHDRSAPSCPSAGETEGHLALKSEIVQAATSLGWEAVPEAIGTGWRADVLATSPDGTRRVAFEVQLAGMTVEEGRRRDALIGNSGVETVWVAARAARWLFSLPSVQVSAAGSEVERSVVAGCSEYVNGMWTSPRPFPFARFVTSTLQGRLEVFQPGRWRVNLAMRWDAWRDSEWKPYLWTKPGDRARFEKETRTEVAVEAARRSDRLKREHHIEELLARQKRLLSGVRTLANETTGLAVWAGDPPRWSPEDAAPSLRYAMGIPIWVGKSAPQTVWAVVCPVASRLRRCAPALRGVALFAETEHEAKRLLGAGVSCPVRVLPATPLRLG